MSKISILIFALVMGAQIKATANLQKPMVNLPADDSYHDSPLEWWYWTGHLQAEDGSWFGFEQTFFTTQAFGIPGQTVHFAITDVRDKSFHYKQEYDVSAPKWVQNGFQLQVGQQRGSGGNGRDEVHGEAKGYRLDLSVQAQKNPVFQFGGGFLKPAFGGDTYYYSRARMAATGVITKNGKAIPVHGSVWFDHQWGNMYGGAAKMPSWDWFALQLDDNRELMLVTLRDFKGKTLFASGSLSDANGMTQQLNEKDFVVKATKTWRKWPCRYPNEWNISAASLNLHVKPVLADQELVVTPTRYWEGAALVDGDVSGRAYVEMTGRCNQAL